MPDLVVAIVARVATPDQSAFQLRKGEAGISVFEFNGVDPPLTEQEILDSFRPGSVVLHRTIAEIIALGLEVVATEGAESLPDRLRLSHREIVAGRTMSRSEFKAALRELEP